MVYVGNIFLQGGNYLMKRSARVIQLAIMAILFYAVPCSAAYVVVDGANSPYALTTEVDDFIEVAGSDSFIWSEGPGILHLMAGGYASDGVYINNGGTINIYGSHTWDMYDALIIIAETANVMLFTDSTDSILLNTVSGPDATLSGTTITVDTINGWMGVLTWVYDGNTYSLSIATSSDITVEVVGSSDTIELEIDIKPGSVQNNINLKSMGVVPVAVLTTDNFDAATIDPATVEFAGAVPKRWKLMDVDCDGHDDMMFLFKTRELELNQDSTEATLTVQSLTREEVSGTDEVQIVPSKKSKKKK